MIKQSDTEKKELIEIVRGKQVTRIDLNSEGGQQVMFHSALRIKMTLTINQFIILSHGIDLLVVGRSPPYSEDSRVVAM